jgi:hypothetical protein
MSKGIDIRFVQEAYQRMPDDELVRIATQDATGLTPEAIDIVKSEILRRGLDVNIAKGVDVQNRDYTIEDIDAYCNIISQLNCPFCGSAAEKLNATVTAEVMSFVVFSVYNKKVKIGCPGCLSKANNNALAKTVLLGWWGIPWGVIRTVQSIAVNIRSKKANHLQGHSDYLRGFVAGAIGEIETYKDNKGKLQQLLVMQNNAS